ncbi:MAG: hypothetical protein H0X24_24840 [Ktedonobacterales bacterium]|nr:hypothetical protein [Ktedonobacterales bacterium]
MSLPLTHAVVRAQVRRALLEREVSHLREALADARTQAERASLTERLDDAERGLRALGPDPAPKMS